MSKTQTGFNVSLVVQSVDHLPTKDGEQMYAEDVEVECRDVVQAAVTAWYERRGKDLLACEPLVC